MTLVDMHLFMAGIQDFSQTKLEQELLIQDKMNHMLGQYIAIGVNDPKKYPRAPYGSKQLPAKEEKRQMTDAEMELSLKAWMGALGGEEEIYGE